MRGLFTGGQETLIWTFWSDFSTLEVQRQMTYLLILIKIQGTFCCFGHVGELTSSVSACPADWSRTHTEWIEPKRGLERSIFIKTLSAVGSIYTTEMPILTVTPYLVPLCPDLCVNIRDLLACPGESWRLSSLVLKKNPLKLKNYYFCLKGF